MKRIDFFLDFISPYAYLAFEKLPLALEGLSYEVVYRPVLLGALLRHRGQLGPAEIPGKREWTFRHVEWVAKAQGVPFQMPAAHPFNPLGLLRLAIACGHQGLPNRYQCETILRHVWCTGAAADDPARLAELTAQLKPLRDPASDEVKNELKAATDAAIAAGLFGVPSLMVDGELFWGFESLPMLREHLVEAAGKSESS